MRATLETNKQGQSNKAVIHLAHAWGKTPQCVNGILRKRLKHLFLGGAFEILVLNVFSFEFVVGPEEVFLVDGVGAGFDDRLGAGIGWHDVGAVGRDGGIHRVRQDIAEVAVFATTANGVDAAKVFF
jgi:hypothetical protein